MRICPKCNQTYEDSLQFCRKCGQKLVDIPVLETVGDSTYAEKGHIGVNSHLRGYRGGNYELLSVVGEGGEGIIYAVQDENKVAKIYKKELAEREGKLRLMVDHYVPNMDSLDGYGGVNLTWPIDVLYDRNNDFVGYVMPRIKAGVEIFEVARGTQSPKVMSMFPDYNWMLNLKVALNLAIAIEHIHSFNVVIGDMNAKNILVNPDHSITILDCDSFDIIDPATRIHYKCVAATEDYLAPELHGKNLRNDDVSFTRRSDEFSLAVHIFQLLMDNRYPFTGVKSEKANKIHVENARLDNVENGFCPYTNKLKDMTIPLGAPSIDEVLPEVIKKDFQNTFNYNKNNLMSRIPKRTTATVWKTHLRDFFLGRISGAHLVQCPNQKHHVYISEKGTCGFCAAEERYRAKLLEINRIKEEKRRLAKMALAQNQIENGNGPSNSSVSNSTVSNNQSQNSINNKVRSFLSQTKLGSLKQETWLLLIFVVFIGFSIIAYKMQPTEQDKAYSSAMDSYKKNLFLEASQKFKDLQDFKDSREMYRKSQYNHANYLLNVNSYNEAFGIFQNMEDYEDSKSKMEEIKGIIYKRGIDAFNSKQYFGAVFNFEKIRDYKDSEQKLMESQINYINSNLDATDKYTQAYLSQLKDKHPQGFDWEALNKKVYAWRIVHNGITSSGKWENNGLKSYPKGKTGHVLFTLKGGPLKGETEINITAIFGNGFKTHAHFDKKPAQNTYSLKFTTNDYLDLYYYDSDGNEIGRLHIDTY